MGGDEVRALFYNRRSLRWLSLAALLAALSFVADGLGQRRYGIGHGRAIYLNDWRVGTILQACGWVVAAGALFGAWRSSRSGSMNSRRSVLAALGAGLLLIALAATATAAILFSSAVGSSPLDGAHRVWARMPHGCQRHLPRRESSVWDEAGLAYRYRVRRIRGLF